MAANGVVKWNSRSDDEFPDEFRLVLFEKFGVVSRIAQFAQFAQFTRLSPFSPFPLFAACLAIIARSAITANPALIVLRSMQGVVLIPEISSNSTTI